MREREREREGGKKRSVRSRLAKQDNWTKLKTLRKIQDIHRGAEHVDADSLMT